jgi:diaminopimelate decarboxylase
VRNVTAGRSTPSHRSMDWRLGVVDHPMVPVPSRAVPNQGDGSASQATAPVALRLLPETALIAPTGRLSVGGVDVVDLAEEVGTPVFVYDEAHLRNRCREAYGAFGEGVAYASKAFLCRAMANLVDQEGLMIDVASGGELYVALSAGVPPERLVLHGSNKSSGELSMALTLGLGRIVVDSFDEIERIERLSADVASGVIQRAKQKVLVRINPGVDVHTHAALATGQRDSKFGFSVSSGAASEAISRLMRPESPVELMGLHAHLGSQVLDLSSIERMVGALAPLLQQAGLREVCVGGGLGVAYTARDAPPPSIDHWARVVRQACRAAGIPASIHLTAEPGRAIAASAAVTCYTIGTIKSVPLAFTDALPSDLDCHDHMHTYVSVDGGMSDNPRPSLYGSRYEAFLPRETSARRPRAATVVGKHCESGDVIVREAQLPMDAAVGDVLVTPVTGAYGYAMASTYNRLLRPPVVFVHDGSYRVVTRRESYKDLLHLEV